MHSLFSQAMEFAARTLIGIAPITLFVATILTIASKFDRIACNVGRTWWSNAGLKTDFLYTVVIPFLIPRMRVIAAIAVTALFSLVKFVTSLDCGGLKVITELPLFAQGITYVIMNDLLLYWFHRAFHTPCLWHIHAIHHSARDVDWTTGNRFHPLNILMGSMMITISLLYIGISPVVVISLSYVDALYSYFVHANFNFTFGPLKYVFASPVFHRWHHTPLGQLGHKNFAATFAFWDVIFGTFCMPKELPENYGLEDNAFPTGFVGQLLYPFCFLRSFLIRYSQSLQKGALACVQIARSRPLRDDGRGLGAGCNQRQGDESRSLATDHRPREPGAPFDG